MKVLWWLVGIIALAIILIYTVVFTTFGNNLMRPILQSEVQKKTMLPAKLTVFELSLHHIKIHLDIDKSNSVDIGGTYSFLFKNINLLYNVHLGDLKALDTLAKTKLQGAFDLNGTVTGDKDNLKINGKTNIAKSDTTFALNVRDLKPKSLTAAVEHLNLATLLAMVNQPHYADAIVDVHAKIPNLSEDKLDGTVQTDITKGLLDSKYLSKAYKFKNMPRINFTAKTVSLLTNSMINTKTDIKSNLATLTVKNATFNVEKGSLVSDYTVKILDLSKLYFVTNRPLQGAVTASGEIEKDKHLKVTVNSNIFGGKVDAVLKDSQLQANLHGLNTIPLLHMLTYPTIFDSKVDATLAYNTVKQVGTLKGTLSNGHFSQNTMLSLIQQYSKVNFYKEKFNGTIKSDINKQTIVSDIALTSNNASIKTNGMVLNSAANTIDANVNIVANKNPITVSVKGNIKKPKIGLDASKLIKEQAGKAVKKEVGNLLKKLF